MRSLYYGQVCVWWWLVGWLVQLRLGVNPSYAITAPNLSKSNLTELIVFKGAPCKKNKQPVRASIKSDRNKETTPFKPAHIFYLQIFWVGSQPGISRVRSGVFFSLFFFSWSWQVDNLTTFCTRPRNIFHVVDELHLADLARTVLYGLQLAATAAFCCSKWPSSSVKSLEQCSQFFHLLHQLLSLLGTIRRRWKLTDFGPITELSIPNSVNWRWLKGFPYLSFQDFLLQTASNNLQSRLWLHTSFLMR